MAKRGRKPKEERKGYFYDREEQAVVAYNASDSAAEKNRIYEEVLKPAFLKMIESIIRRYKLYGPEEEFTETFNDTLSFMVAKMGNYRPYINKYVEGESKKANADAIVVGEEEFMKIRKDAPDGSPEYITVLSPEPHYYHLVRYHYKAYSYCGTVAKNFLIQKIKQYQKKLLRNTPYEEISETIVNNIRYSDVNEENNTASELISNMSRKVKTTLENAEEEGLTEKEVKVGKSLVFLLDNWEEILSDDGSNKLNKSSVLYFLREDTLLTTKEIRDSMKKFKAIYKLMKQTFLD